MNKLIHRFVPVLFLAASLAGCSHPKVAQGTVVSVNAKTHVMVVRDELPPNPDLSFAIGDAEVGGKFSPGDVVRIAYDEDGTTLRASRVMNLTAQKKAPKH